MKEYIKNHDRLLAKALSLENTVEEVVTKFEAELEELKKKVDNKAELKQFLILEKIVKSMYDFLL